MFFQFQYWLYSILVLSNRTKHSFMNLILYGTRFIDNRQIKNRILETMSAKSLCFLQFPAKIIWSK